MRIVGIGGGTGLPVMLSGLKQLRDSREEEIDITAIVTVADSGGSTGELRRCLGMPAMGDLRNCLVALAGSESVMADLCRHRFENARTLSGHSMGNLILSALYQMSGDLPSAVQLASDLLDLKGHILPSTAESLTLCAEYADGVVVRGEVNIPKRKSRICRVWVEPESPRPAPGVIEAIAMADAIVFGPGSLYTSVIPNLLVSGVPYALKSSSALKIYVCNLMTQTGETDEFSAVDHLRSLQAYLLDQTIDVCVMNTRSARSSLAEEYAMSGAQFVIGNEEDVQRLGVDTQSTPLLQQHGAKIRHDSVALARTIVMSVRKQREEEEVLCAES
jgi:uncharacterized cofD-like protein